MATCPLCDRPNVVVHGPVAGRDATVIECPACGRFGVDNLMRAELATSYADQRFLLSAATRALSEARKPTIIDDSTLDALIASVRPHGSLYEMVDRALLLAGSHAKEYWLPSELNVDTDWPLTSSRSAEELNYVFSIAGEKGYLQHGNLKINPDGWDRIEQLRVAQPTSRQAFVAMWFDSQMDDAWMHGLKPGIEDTKYYSAMRVSDVMHNDKIDDRIVAEIRKSGLVVADFTGNRGGVYFEAGLALGLGIPVVWTCREDAVSSVHFDTRQYNHVVWKTPSELREKLKARLEATVVPAGAVLSA